MDSEGKRRVIRIGVWVAILGLLLGVLSSIIMATGAEAHAALESISPKDGSSVTTAPRRVVLTFSEPISTSFATVTVTGPDGVVSEGRTAVDGVTVTQALAPDVANGRYTVTYRVVSEDGHPVSDRTTFTVAAAAPATTPSETSVPSATPLPASPSLSSSSAGSTLPDDADAAGSGRGLRIGLAVGVAALALAGGTALVASGRRRSGGDPGE